MSVTERHHFIPIFYLKQFTDDEGFFYVYDVKKNQFKANGKRFAPSTHFYEYNTNTVFNGFESSDFIEHGYSEHDSKISAIINKIRINQNWKLEEEEWILLQYFVNIMYWRIPSNIDRVNDYIKNATSISDFRVKIMDEETGSILKGTEDLELLEKMKINQEFPKFLKLMLPGITYPEIFEKANKDHAHIKTFPHAENLPKMVSDNPIIFRRPGKESLHTDEFIFPLTPNQILFRHRFKNVIVHSYLRVLMDMLLLMQARDYVSCTDLKYPFLLKEQFYKKYSSVEDLRNSIFNLILEYTQF